MQGIKGVGFAGTGTDTYFTSGSTDRFFVADSGTTYAVIPTSDLLSLVQGLGL